MQNGKHKYLIVSQDVAEGVFNEVNLATNANMMYTEAAIRTILEGNRITRSPIATLLIPPTSCIAISYKVDGSGQSSAGLKIDNTSSSSNEDTKNWKSSELYTEI